MVADDAPRLVKCVKIGRELPGVRRKPFQDDLGQKIYDNVSEDAWQLWVKHMTMLVNEYKLSLANSDAQKFLKEQCEAFFFGEGSALPPDYKPPAAKH